MAEGPDPGQTPAKTPATPTIKELSNALDSVVNWYSLGIKLGMKAHELATIEKNYHGDNDRCKLEMLNQSLQSAKLPSWRVVVEALQEMGELAVALKIQRKYCSSSTGTATPPPTSPQSPITLAVAKRNIQMIKGKFSILVTKSRRKLQSRKINVDDVQMFLITLYSSPDSKDGSDTVTTVVECARSLDEIFRALSKHRLWDYINYYLLQSIIEQFADDDNELKRMMEQYQKDLTGYVLTLRIQTYLDATDFEYPIAMSDSEISADEEIITSLPLQQKHELFKKLTIKYKVNVTDHTLSYVIDLWRSLSNQLALPRPAMILHDIAEGSIGITWLIPANLIKHITQMAQETTNMFVEENVLRVTLEEQCIYAMEAELVSEPTLLEMEPSLLHSKPRPLETETTALKRKTGQDIPCLGRIFRLGMLYDCRSDCLVPGVTLWDSSTLQQATEQSPQLTSAFELISEDSLASKTSHLGMQTNMKLSFLTGLVNISRSAKYLEDHKSSSKQARVTFKYSGTTRFEKLAIDKLGSVHHPTVRGSATHIVTGILYGAEAFFVFDQKVAPGENYQTVHENMIKGIKYLPGNVTAADMTKVQCTVYCDFQLPENPTSFKDTAKVLEKLPKLAENNNIVVPKRVILYPLDKLDSSAGRLLRDVSPALVTEVESFVEVFHKLQMQCNDLIETEVSTNFPAIQKQLSYFQEILTAYKSNIVKQLGVLLPQVRGGESQEADMTKTLRANEVSPFGKQKILSWLSKKEHEVNVLSSYLKNMKEIPFVASPNELDAIVSNFQYDFVLCFSFLITGENDAYLQCLSEYLHKQLKQGSNDTLPKQWHEDRTVIQDMRSKARQFKDFVEANKMQQNTTFIVSTCVDFESSTNNVAAILLFKDGIPEKFCPPSQPGKPTSTKVTNDSILLEWSTPKCGCESVLSYTISYCMDNDPTNHWKVKRTQDSRNTTMITQLTPKAKYRFKVKAQCEIGVSLESEISDPIETSPNYTANQVEDETPVSEVSDIETKPPFVPERPGKPIASKITHNSVHLNWSVHKAGKGSIKCFSVLYRRMDDPSAEWQTTKTQGSQKEVTVSGLAPITVYCFKIRAESEAGVSPDSEMSEPIATSPPPVPGRPGKPIASKMTHNTIHLTWPGPKSGIEDVTFYSVLYRRMDDPSAEWQTTKTQGSQKEVTVSGLVAKAVYCFKVHAECKDGISPDSEMSEPILTEPPPIPIRPGKPTASKTTHESIHLNWPGPKTAVESVAFYSVLYRRMDDRFSEWQTTRTQGS